MDWSWASLREDTLASAELVEREKAEACAAIEWFAAELGDDYPSSSPARDGPFWSTASNGAAWTRRRLIWLRMALLRIRGVETSELLMRRAFDAHRWPEAMDVLEVADVALRGGLEVQFDPELRSEGGLRTPDLLVTRPGSSERLVIEITRQHGPPEIPEWTELTIHLAPALVRLGPEYVYAMSLQTMPTVSDVEGILSRMQLARDDLRRRPGIRVIHEPNRYIAAVASADYAGLLCAWCDVHELEVGRVRGPDFRDGALDKLQRKLRDKATQTRGAESALEVIRNHDLPFRAAPSVVIEELAAALDARFSAAPHVLAVVLLGSQVVGPHCAPSVVSAGPGVKAYRNRFGAYPDTWLIVPNRHSTARVPRRLLVALRRGFVASHFD